MRGSRVKALRRDFIVHNGRPPKIGQGKKEHVQTLKLRPIRWMTQRHLLTGERKNVVTRWFLSALFRIDVQEPNEFRPIKKMWARQRRTLCSQPPNNSKKQ